MTAFAMRVTDIFDIDGKTIFSGEIECDSDLVEPTLATVTINGQAIQRLVVQGPVRVAAESLDLWTTESVSLERVSVLSLEDLDRH